MSGSDFSPSLCAAAHDASRWLGDGGGGCFCLCDDKSKSSKTHTRQKLALSLGSWRQSTLCGRMKNDARRGIKVSEMGSPTV
jgi:hypothetical protein